MASKLFDQNWREKEIVIDSWKSDVLDSKSGSGGAYLELISKWFFDFPGTKKEKKHLKSLLMSHINADHLGAVNELSWWKLLTSRKYDLVPISAGKGPAPDFSFRVSGEEIAFLEVTTLNPSLNPDCSKLKISQANSIKRILRKASEEKLGQFRYGFVKNVPSILVVFNYDEWSGYGTRLCNSIDIQNLFKKMPNELSGIIYLEKYVADGKIYLKRDAIVMIENYSSELPVPIEIKFMVENIKSENDSMIICR